VAKKRQKQRHAPEYGAQLLWAVASALAPWGSSEIESGLSRGRVLFGWVLLLIPALLLVRLIYLWSTDKHWRRVFRLGVPALALAAFLVIAGNSTYMTGQQTYAYFVPTLITNDGKTRFYAWTFQGDNPLFAVDVSVKDENGFAVALKQNDSQLLEHSIAELFHEQEVDPRYNGIARQFALRPYALGNENLTFNINTRNIDIRQTLNVWQQLPYTFPAFYTKLVDGRTSKTLLECISDSRYVTKDKSKTNLPICCTHLAATTGTYASCAGLPTRLTRAVFSYASSCWHRLSALVSIGQ
jgi:hypothetical protein